MMRSLRSLCLLKVSSEGLDYADLPPVLIKDLNLMKAFNGNFKYELEDYGDAEHTTVLTILYDGVFWTFSSFCWDMGDFYELGFDEFQVIEGKLVSATSPFRYIRHRLEETGYRKEMKMTVNVSQEGTYGIRFSGFNFFSTMQDPEICPRQKKLARSLAWQQDYTFYENMQVYFTMTGTRVLFHDWSFDSRTQNSGWYDGLSIPEDIKLIESQVSAAGEYEGYLLGSEESVSDGDRNNNFAEVEMASMEPLPSPISLPYYENIPGIVTHVSSDRKSVWFCPASFQSALDCLMDKLDKLSTSLNPIFYVIPGQLCVAKYAQDNEIKKIDELYMLPKELLTTPAAAINVETENIDVAMEARMLVEEVVIRLEGWEGKVSSRFFIRGEEIGVTPV